MIKTRSYPNRKDPFKLFLRPLCLYTPTLCWIPASFKGQLGRRQGRFGRPERIREGIAIAEVCTVVMFLPEYDEDEDEVDEDEELRECV